MNFKPRQVSSSNGRINVELYNSDQYNSRSRSRSPITNQYSTQTKNPKYGRNTFSKPTSDKFTNRIKKFSEINNETQQWIMEEKLKETIEKANSKIATGSIKTASCKLAEIQLEALKTLKEMKSKNSISNSKNETVKKKPAFKKSAWDQVDPHQEVQVTSQNFRDMAKQSTEDKRSNINPRSYTDYRPRQDQDKYRNYSKNASNERHKYSDYKSNYNSNYSDKPDRSKYTDYKSFESGRHVQNYESRPYIPDSRARLNQSDDLFNLQMEALRELNKP